MSISDSSAVEDDGPKFSLPWISLIVVSIIPIFLFCFGWYADPQISRADVQTFLTTLIRAEASIIAIIFSVIFLGVQIISSRYTSRMGQLFFSDRLLRLTIAILGITIVFDFILLFFLPNEVSKIYVSFVLSSGGLSIVAFYLLIRSVQRMLVSSTPEGAISTARSNIDIQDFYKYSFNSNPRKPPTREIFSFIIGALTTNEFLTARTAFNQYIGSIVDVINKIRSKDYHQSSIIDILKPICNSQLPDIHLAATRGEERQLQRDTLACQRQLYQIGYQVVNDPRVVSLEGYYRVLSGLNGFEDSQPHLEAEVVEQISLLLTFLLKNREKDASRLIRSLHKRLIDTNSDISVDNQGVTRLLSYLPELHRYAIQFEDPDVQYLESYTGDDIPPERLDVSTHIYTLLYKVSMIYDLDQEIAQCWCDIYSNIVRLSSNKSAEEEYITELLIEYSLIEKTESGNTDNWNDFFREVQMWGNRSYLEGGFDSLEQHVNLQRSQGLHESMSEKGVSLRYLSYTLDSSYNDVFQTIHQIHNSAHQEYNKEIWNNLPVEKIRNIILANPSLIDDSKINLTKKLELRHIHRTYGNDRLMFNIGNQTVIFIKIMKSVNSKDKQDLIMLKNQVYSQVHRNNIRSGSAGPIRLIFIVATPSHSNNESNMLSKIGIQIKEIDGQQLANKTGRQSAISDFAAPDITGYSSDLLVDYLKQ